MRKETYRRLAKKDSARIQCGDMDSNLNHCGQPATICNTVHWKASGIDGVSFFYYCAAHDPRRK